MELTSEAVEFLRGGFTLFEIDGDGAFSAYELEDVFDFFLLRKKLSVVSFALRFIGFLPLSRLLSSCDGGLFESCSLSEFPWPVDIARTMPVFNCT